MVKVGIFIDGMTLFHGLQGKRFHFGDFKEWLLQSDELGFAGYFNSVADVTSKEVFFSHVNKSGFNIFVRQSSFDFISGKIDISSLNVELSLEAINHINDYDKFIIVSGKRDFLPLCEKIILCGKSVEVIGYENSVNKLFDKYPVRYLEDFIDKKK